jgi:hypothetical protein
VLPSDRKYWILRTVCYFVLLGLAVLQLHIARQEQTEFSSTRASAAMLNSLRSSYLLAWHAKRIHLLEGNVAQAEGLLKRALVYNPFYIPAWLGLAELFNDQGKQPESEAILEYVDRLSANINRWRWDKALLAYQFGRMDILASDLSYIIEKIPGQSKQNGLKLAFSIWDEPQELLEKVGVQNVLPLFQYATQTSKTAHMLAFWPYIEELGVSANKKDALLFLETLIQNNEISRAIPIWKKYFSSKELLNDGNFQEEPVNIAFGWMLAKPKGSTWRREHDSGKEKFQTMRIHFSGTENLSYNHLSQLVPLKPARKYRLTGWSKTERLTTDQRPYLEVAGFKCKMTPVMTEKVPANQPWTQFELDFSVAEDCEAVKLQVRRNASDHLDNLLAGDLWLRDLRIDDIDDNKSTLNISPIKSLP